MTLWVFGASGAQMMKGVDDQWMQKAAHLLDTDVRSLALNGSSLEYAYYKFNQIRNDIKTNDIIIFSVIGFERRWLFRDRPSRSVLVDPLTYNKDEEKAVISYRRYLDFKEIHEVYFLNFLSNLNYITNKLNLRTILLNPYLDIEEFLLAKKNFISSIYVAQGLMIDVICNEIKSNFLTGNNTADFFDNDPRLNHLTRSNHLILANKIVDYIKYGVDINLNQDFVENIFVKENINDPEFIKNELFDNVVFKGHALY